VQKNLELFVENSPKLYDDFILKSGFHELLHLSDQVENFEPLNSSSKPIVVEDKFVIDLINLNFGKENSEIYMVDYVYLANIVFKTKYSSNRFADCYIRILEEDRYGIISSLVSRKDKHLKIQMEKKTIPTSKSSIQISSGLNNGKRLDGQKNFASNTISSIAKQKNKVSTTQLKKRPLVES
ncbi:unnamed protein product, partial [Brachionus calyciflorus]